ncbi:MAG: aminotransferase class I/II-fold pyridoxal phosphate-dependent enzyme [Pseudomonadota bacterium]
MRRVTSHAGGSRQADFTSALYLNFQHPAGQLPPWAQLTTGKPAALHEPAAAKRVAAALAALMGFKRAVLAASTLHVAWDVIGDLARQGPTTFFVDAGAYAVLKWGADRARGQGSFVETFPHFDPEALAERIRLRPAGRRVVVVTDGFCPRCNRVAPLGAYRRLLPTDGRLLVDDTQALGLLGARPTRRMPYGLGGGGTLRHLGESTRRVLVMASMAKAFGVPVAVLTGDHRFIAGFEQRSETRVHSSPPSAAVIAAAERALQLNQLLGDERRARLLALVRYFRAQAARAELNLMPGLFPVQSTPALPADFVQTLYTRLLKRGVLAVRLAGPAGRSRLAWILRADHRPEDISRWAFGRSSRLPSRSF